MFLFWELFIIVRLIDSAILTADTIKNVYFRAGKLPHLYIILMTNINIILLTLVLYEIPWQFGICSFSCYLFGIAYTVSNVRYKYSKDPVVHYECMEKNGMAKFSNIKNNRAVK